MKGTVFAIAFAVVGCLSGPTPKDGSNGDAGADATTDGNGEPGEPFPGSRTVDLRDVQLADVNGDGPLDLVFVNQASAAADRGVFVLHGPQTNPAGLRFHQFAQTTAIPHHVALRNVVGDNLLDLIIVGKRDALDDSFIEIYEQSSDGSFTLVGSRVIDGFRPDPMLPIIIELGALTGSVQNDFVVADLFTMYVFLIDDAIPNIVDGLTVPPVLFGRSGTSGGAAFETINGIVARAGSSVADDLWVIENFELTHLENDGAGTFTADPASVSNGGLFPIRTFAEVDIDVVGDSDATLDIVGGGLVDFGAWLIEPNGATVTLEAADWEFPLEDNIGDIAGGNMGEGAAPEVALSTPSAGGGLIHVFLDARRQGAVMSPTSPIQFPVTISPTHLVLGDFDGVDAPEVWAIDGATGAAICVKYASAMLEDCSSN